MRAGKQLADQGKVFLFGPNEVFGAAEVVGIVDDRWVPVAVAEDAIHGEECGPAAVVLAKIFDSRPGLFGTAGDDRLRGGGQC